MALADAAKVALLLAVMLLAGLIVHRVARASPLRRLAPGWASWQAKGKFPMGLALGPTLALYIGLAAFPAT